MDKIIMKGMIFHGFHGVNPEEKILGQKFIIDAVLYTDLRTPGQSDNVEDTTSYAKAYKVIKSVVENYKFDLIEKLADTIAEELFSNFEKIMEVDIIVKKPQAPVKGIFDYFGVEIRRMRNG